MKEVVYVNKGEVKIAGSQTLLRTIAVGSCIIVAAFNFKKKIGAMAHIMFPGYAPEDVTDKTKYAGDAIEEIVNRITLKNSKPCDIKACLVESGNIFEDESNVDKANIESAIHILKKKNIEIKAWSVSGTKRRSVIMDTKTGRVSYTYTEGEKVKRTVWQINKRFRK